MLAALDERVEVAEVTATKSPSFSSNVPGQMCRSAVFSSMHSIADSRSLTA